MWRIRSILILNAFLLKNKLHGKKMKYCSIVDCFIDKTRKNRRFSFQLRLVLFLKKKN